MAAEGNSSRDCCGDERDASDADEDTESANEDVVGVLLDHGRPCRPFRLRQLIHLVAENAEADPYSASQAP